MTYTRFERTVVSVGAAAVLTLMVVSVLQNVPAFYLIGELLLWPVLATAVHFGRRAGFAAAIAAATVLVMVTIPAMASPGGLPVDALLFLAGCVAGYGVLGILGGEFAGRLRYLQTRLEESSAVDTWSGAYNQCFIATELGRSLAENACYGREFSVMLLALHTEQDAEQTPRQRRATARSVVNLLRGDVRMVDLVARLDDGRFFVLMPQTPASGATMAAGRLTSGLRQLLEVEPAALSVRCLSTGDDETALASLSAELATRPYCEADQASSGAYSSLGASDLKPDAVSTSSAPTASTLKMSTAAAPDGSTKQ